MVFIAIILISCELRSLAIYSDVFTLIAKLKKLLDTQAGW